MTGAHGHAKVAIGAPAERASERFFEHTPMAIATVNRGGVVVRANARFPSWRKA